MFDTAAIATDPAPSRVRIVHPGGALDVELLPGSATVLDLTALKGQRGDATKVLGFLGVVALVAGASWGAAVLLPRPPVPDGLAFRPPPSTPAVSAFAPRSPSPPPAPGPWPTPPDVPEATVPAAPQPPAPIAPSEPAGRDPFGLLQR